MLLLKVVVLVVMPVMRAGGAALGVEPGILRLPLGAWQKYGVICSILSNF